MMVAGDETWEESRMYIMKTLDDIQANNKKILDEIVNLKVRVGTISGIVSLIIATVSTLITNLLTR